MAIRVYEFGQAVRVTHEFWARYEYNGEMMAITLGAPDALACLESAGYDLPLVQPYIPFTSKSEFIAQAAADVVDLILCEYEEKAASDLIRQAMLDSKMAWEVVPVFYDITEVKPAQLPNLIF